jgi:hypothetical protein
MLRRSRVDPVKKGIHTESTRLRMGRDHARKPAQVNGALLIWLRRVPDVAQEKAPA